MSVRFEEIFDGCSDVRSSLGLPTVSEKADVVLKLDTVQWLYEPANAVPSAMVSKLENESFANMVAGETVTPEYAFGPESTELQAFRNLKPIAARHAPVIGTEMRDLLKSLTKRTKSIAVRDAPRHRAKLKGIIDEFKSTLTFRSIGDDGQWDRLVDHAVDFVAQTLHECASEQKV
jgi:hypothetical protein